MLFSNAKLPKAADQDIVTVFQSLLHQLEERLDDLGRLAFGEQILGEKVLDDLGFGKSHRLILEI